MTSLMKIRTTKLIMNKVIKFIQINKGDSNLINRVDQISNLLEIHKPHLMIINELNNEFHDSVTKHSFPNYHLEADNLEIYDEKSRTGLLIHNSIHYKRRIDLETPGTSTVWVQLSHPGKKPILVQGIYRQFQRLGKVNTASISSQKYRWNQILTKWEQAILEEKEIIVLGDMNLNTIRWEVPFDQKSDYEKSQNDMVLQMKERILQKGFKILNSDPTRQKDNVEAKPACLDLLLTNMPEKIASYQSGISMFSDHTLQILNRRAKNVKLVPKMIRLRSFKKFDKQKFRENIMNHPNYIEIMYEQDPSVITVMLQKIIQESIHDLATIKIIQVSQKNTNILTPETKDLMVQRDIALDDFKKSNLSDDLRYYKNLKNRVNQNISKERFKRKLSSFQGEGISLKMTWNKMKQETGQSKHSTPQSISEGN